MCGPSLKFERQDRSPVERSRPVAVLSQSLSASQVLVATPNLPFKHPRLTSCSGPHKIQMGTTDTTIAPIPHTTHHPMNFSTAPQSTPAYEPASVYLLWISGYNGIHYPGVFLHNSNNKGRLVYGCDMDEYGGVVRTFIREPNMECSRIHYFTLSLPVFDSCRSQISPTTSYTAATKLRAFAVVGVSQTGVSLPATTAMSVGSRGG